jgi:hypothetical protein
MQQRRVGIEDASIELFVRHDSNSKAAPAETGKGTDESEEIRFDQTEDKEREGDGMIR